MDLVAEVHEAGLGQQPLVRLVELGQLDVAQSVVALLVARCRGEPRFGPGTVLLRRDVLVLGTADERRERRKMTCSGCESTRNWGSSPASTAASRSTRSPKAWKVRIGVSA
jgi:hypothetical protein